MKIAISAESTIDLPREILDEFNISTVPFTIIMGEVEKKDGEFPVQELFDFTKKTGKLPKTAAVNEFQYDDHFERILKEYDYVIHFSLSSEMSAAYANALKSAKKFNNRVRVIDTRTLSTGIALLAINASKLAKEGKTIDEIVKSSNERVPHTEVSFVLHDVKSLYKGGRCSAMQLFGANLLKLRPEILVKDGKMGPARKFRGKMELCVANYCADILAQYKTPDLDLVFITTTTVSEESMNAARKALKNRGFKRIIETHAGGTISSHCGENCLGILYLNDGE